MSRFDRERPPGEPVGKGCPDDSRIKCMAVDGYLDLVIGAKFAELDLVDAADEAAIENFVAVGQSGGFDRLLFDVTASSNGFGINAFRRIAEAHRRTGYHVRKVAVFALSKAEYLRAELGRVVVAADAGGPEIRVFESRSDATDWLRSAED